MQPTPSPAAVKALRHARGLSVRELAAAAQIGTATLWRLEEGHVKRTRMSTVRALAEALGMPVSALLESEAA